MTGQMSAVELLGTGIDALARADAFLLEGLAEAAGGVPGPRTACEGRLARERLRTLEHLLTLTRRNLRLLRGRGGYGWLRGTNGDDWDSP
jgi:hypothetical protein